MFHLHMDIHYLMTQIDYNESPLFRDIFGILALCVGLFSLNMGLDSTEYWKQLTFYFCWHFITVGASQSNYVLICNQQKLPLI